MTLREWLSEHTEVASVDYTYYAKDGNIEYNYVTREDILRGSWDVPEGIAECEVIKAGTETIEENDVVGYVNIRA